MRAARREGEGDSRQLEVIGSGSAASLAANFTHFLLALCIYPSCAQQAFTEHLVWTDTEMVTYLCSSKRVKSSWREINSPQNVICGPVTKEDASRERHGHG